MRAPGLARPLADAVVDVRGEDLTRFLPPDDGGRESAVLILLGEGPAGPDLLLIERAARHALPRRASRPSRAGPSTPATSTPSAAALREAQEETGLDASGVQVVGELPRLWLPPSGFVVTPVLGLVAHAVRRGRRRPARGRGGPPGADRRAHRPRATATACRTRAAGSGRRSACAAWSCGGSPPACSTGCSHWRAGSGPGTPTGSRTSRPSPLTELAMTGFDWLVLGLVPVMVYLGYRLGFLVSTSPSGASSSGSSSGWRQRRR